MAIVNTVKVHVAPWNYMKAVAFSSGAVNTTTPHKLLRKAKKTNKRKLSSKYKCIIMY